MDTLAFKAEVAVADRPAEPPLAQASSAKTSMIVKNAGLVALLAGGWFALDTGYLGEDRVLRSQWERFEKRTKLEAEAVVYQADFSKVKAGETSSTGTWARYNLATPETTVFEPSGVTVNYPNAAWLGASYSMASYVPNRFYRVTFDADVEGQPGAVIVRNRQMDIDRTPIPVGKSQQTVHFFSPSGARNQAHIIFMPDYATDPQGKLKITSFKIELLKE